MKNTSNLETYEPVTFEPLTIEPVTLEPRVVVEESLPTAWTLPAAPFPHKYVHSVFLTLQDARQAALALLAAGFAAREIHLLESREYVEAVSQGQSFLGFLTSTDYDVYLSEARRGRFFLAVRPASFTQLKQIRDLLAPHRARLARYIDTWTMSELLA